MTTLASSRAMSQRITSPGGPARRARQEDQVAGRGRRVEQVEDLLGERRRARRSAGGPSAQRIRAHGRRARRPSRLGACSPTTTCTCGPTRTARPPERYFTAENVERYLAAAAAAGIDELGVSEHVHRFRQALELWRHPFWEEQARGRPRRLLRVRPRRRRCGSGIECDFVPGAEDRTASLLEARDFDYVVGSVHFVGEVAVDHEGFDVWERSGDPDEVWRRYFETLAECARSGLFDILAHPDLVKVWGGGRPLPERDPRHYYEPAVEAIAESGIAVEVSTAGLRKPVGELYPSPGLRRDVRRGGRLLRALLGRPPARAGRLRLRPGARLPRPARRRARSPSSRVASGAWSRSGAAVGEN